MQEIEKLRSEIDELHLELTQILKRRLVLTHKIWQIKKRLEISFVDPKREIQIMQNIEVAAENSIEREFLKNIFQNLIAETKNYLEAKIK